MILTGCSKNSAGGDVVIDGTLNGQISLSKDEYVYYIDQNEDVVYRKDNSNNTVAVTRNVFFRFQEGLQIFILVRTSVIIFWKMIEMQALVYTVLI